MDSQQSTCWLGDKTKQKIKQNMSQINSLVEGKSYFILQKKLNQLQKNKNNQYEVQKKYIGYISYKCHDFSLLQLLPRIQTKIQICEYQKVSRFIKAISIHIHSTSIHIQRIYDISHFSSPSSVSTIMLIKSQIYRFTLQDIFKEIRTYQVNTIPQSLINYLYSSILAAFMEVLDLISADDNQDKCLCYNFSAENIAFNKFYQCILIDPILCAWQNPNPLFVCKNQKGKFMNNYAHKQIFDTIEKMNRYKSYKSQGQRFQVIFDRFKNLKKFYKIEEQLAFVQQYLQKYQIKFPQAEDINYLTEIQKMIEKHNPITQFYCQEAQSKVQCLKKIQKNKIAQKNK